MVFNFQFAGFFPMCLFVAVHQKSPPFAGVGSQRVEVLPELLASGSILVTQEEVTRDASAQAILDEGFC